MLPCVHVNTAMTEKLVTSSPDAHATLTLRKTLTRTHTHTNILHPWPVK